MPLWIPILKAALPYVTTIVTSAMPVFTARKEQEKANDLVSRQIAELQDAVTANAASVKLLAEQLQRTLSAVEQGAGSLEQKLQESRELLARHQQQASEREQRIATLERRLRALQRLSLIAFVGAALACVLALLAWMG